MSWTQFYAESYKEIIKKIKKIQGIAVGFNTNLDAIIEFNGKMILELIKHLKIDSFSLYKKIIEWKGRIIEPIDFVTGLCGCFEKGKASEWLIDNHYALFLGTPISGCSFRFTVQGLQSSCSTTRINMSCGLLRPSYCQINILLNLQIIFEEV